MTPRMHPLCQIQAIKYQVLLVGYLSYFTALIIAIRHERACVDFCAITSVCVDDVY